MMHYVRRPPKAAFMTGPMKAVIADLVSEEAQHPRPPDVSNIEYRELVQEGEYRKHHGLREQVHHYVSDPHRQAGGSVLELVEIATQSSRRDRFCHEQDKKTGNRVDDQVRHDWTAISLARVPLPGDTLGKRKSRRQQCRRDCGVLNFLVLVF